MDPIEKKRRQLEEDAARRRSANSQAPTEELAHSIASEFTAEPPAEDPETARMRLELERQRLELERDRLLLERQKLEMDRKTASGPRRPVSDRQRAARPPSGESTEKRAPRAPAARPPRKSGNGALVASVFGVVAAAVTIFGVLFLFGDRNKLVGSTAQRPGEPPELAALRAKAETGDGEAALSLGVFLWNGTGGYRRPQEAKDWLHLAAQNGDAKVSAHAVMALDWIKNQEREQQARAIQVAELEAERTRREAEQRKRERELALRRQAEQEEARQVEEKRREEVIRERRAQLRAAVRQIRQDVQQALPKEFLDAVARLDLIEADPQADDEVRTLVRGAREVAETFRFSCGDRGVSQARRLADKKQFAEAIEALRYVEMLGHKLSDAVHAERQRWRDERVAAAEANAAAEQAAEDAQREEEQAAEQEEEEAPSAVGADEPQVDLAAIERDVRKRVGEWFKARTARALRCLRCDGAQQVRCSDCGGDGLNTIQTKDGTYEERCRSCQASGIVACPDQLCLRGARSLSLKKAFWDFFSPAFRKGRSHASLYRELFDGVLRSYVGSSLVVRSAEVTSVDIQENRVAVLARVTWESPAGVASTSAWTSTWIRVGRRFYVATSEDTEVDKLR